MKTISKNLMSDGIQQKESLKERLQGYYAYVWLVCNYYLRKLFGNHDYSLIQANCRRQHPDWSEKEVTRYCLKILKWESVRDFIFVCVGMILLGAFLCGLGWLFEKIH